MHCHKDKLLFIVIGLQKLVIRIILRHASNQILCQIHLLCGLLKLFGGLYAFYATFEKTHTEIESFNSRLIRVYPEHLRHDSVKTFIIRTEPHYVLLNWPALVLRQT